MAVPAANPVSRMETVAANLLGRELKVSDSDDLALLTRVVDRFASHWQTEFDAAAADPEQPTNAEKASFFLAKLGDIGRAILRAEGERAAREDPTVIAAAGDAAAADFGE